MRRRVAITGLGVVSPLGLNVETTWQQLQAGQSGIHRIQQFDASGFPARIAAEVKKFIPDAALHTKANRFASRTTLFALQAALEAMRDANMTVHDSIRERFGVVVGSGMMTAKYDDLHRFQQACAVNGEVDWAEFRRKSSEFCELREFASTTSNTGLSLLIQQFGLRGYATAVHTACASSGQALGLAMRVIQRGDADYILAGGFDSMISPLGLSSFCLLGALSTDNDDPERASRPFDATRNGFVLGEGAAFLMLEEWSRAKARGARIYAELAGEGNTLSAYRITDSPPDGSGAIQAILGGLRDANLSPDDVDYINAHGTSTHMNDLSETNAIKTVFGERAYQIPVSSTKSQTGHLIAAAGALEAVFSVLSIQHSQIPMTANRLHPDADCDLDYVTEGPRAQSVNVVLSNSFGFGGSNSCLLFKHPELGE